MLRSIRLYSCLALVGIFFVSSCQKLPPDKRIDDVNTAKAKARKLSEQAERKRREGVLKSEKSEHDKLVDEAADLYGQAADTLNGAAATTDELAKLKQPGWYEEYFGLQSKLTRNLAQMAKGAHDELLAGKSGPPSDSQVQSAKENIIRIRNENEELRTRIKTIETREGVVLINE